MALFTIVLASLLHYPMIMDAKPITLYGSLFIERIHSFDWSTGDFEATVELLLSSESTETATGSGFELSTIDAQTEPHPFSDISFDSHRIQVLGEMRWVTRAGGDVVTSKQRARLWSNCDFSTWRYPFESHVCAIRIVSARHTALQLTLQWTMTSSPIRVVSGRHLTASGAEIHDLTPVSTSYDSVYSITSGGSRTGSHSCLEARFTVSRPISRFFWSRVLPSLLIPLLIWISFFTDRSILVLRFFIISFSGLVLSILVVALNHAAPSTDSITLADIWSLIHFGFFLFGLVHFFVLLSLENLHKKYRELSRRSDYVREESRRRYERRANNRLIHEKGSGNGDGRRQEERNGLRQEQEPLTTALDRTTTSVFRSRSDRYSLYGARWDVFGRSAIIPAYLLAIIIYFIWNLVLYDDHLQKD